MNKTEMKKLFNRVYNDEMTVDAETKLHDSDTIKAICEKVFGDGSVTPGPETLHNFNNLIIEFAEEVAKPIVSDLTEYLASYKKETRGNVKQFKLPRNVKTKLVWSANGSGVDLIRVAGKKTILAVPQTFSTGFYYEPADLVTDSVTTFRQLIDDLAEAKARLYLEKISAVITAGVTGSDIPSNNVVSGSNTAIADYNKLVSRASRYGGVPTLIADSVMINDLAMKQVADTTLSNVISDDYGDELLRSLNVTSIGRSRAINLINPFTDLANSQVDLNVQEGYMVTGLGQVKPVNIVEYGGMRQAGETHMEDGRVKVKIEMDASVILVHGNVLFYLKDTALTV